MSQKVKCPRCKNVFSIEDAHEHEIKNLKEKAKKEALAEAQVEKAKADKEIKLKKQALQAEKEKLKKDAKKEALAEAQVEKAKADKEIKLKKQALQAEKEKLKKDAKKEALAEVEAEKAKADKEKNKIKQDYEKKLQTKEKEHALDMKRVKEKQKIAFDIASQTAVEKKGEAQEELLEDFLKDKFPYDKIEPVKKGKRGGDLIQTVIDKKNNQTGKILHERKEVLKFDEQWVDKLLKDMSSIDATQGIIFTKSMPKKSNGLWQEREGGRIIICGEDYLLLELAVSLRRKIILQEFFHKSEKNSGGGSLKPLADFLSSNEFKLEYRKAFKNLKSEFNQIEKDERSFSNQIIQRKKNYEDKKTIMNNILPKIIMKANLPDFLEGIDEDNLLE